MTTPDPKHVEELARLVATAKDALKAAQNYADEHALSFRWSDEYGSREQQYLGRGYQGDEWSDSGCSYGWEDSGCTDNYVREGRWVSSSDDC